MKGLYLMINNFDNLIFLKIYCIMIRIYKPLCYKNILYNFDLKYLDYLKVLKGKKINFKIFTII